MLFFFFSTAGAVVEVGSDETPTEVRVYCNVRDAAAATGPDAAGQRPPQRQDVRSTYCKLTLPQEAHTLSLAYGRGTARYAYHGATETDCGVSFAKPVRRAETGRWKCANAMPDGRVYGGFVVVAGAPSDDGTQPRQGNRKGKTPAPMRAVARPAGKPGPIRFSLKISFQTI